MESYVPSEGNVASFDQMKDNPLIVQQGSFHAFEQLPASLAEQGVILQTFLLLYKSTQN